MTPEKFIQKVLAKAGGPTAVAALLAPVVVKRQNVEYWVKAGEIPAEHCPTLERALGFKCEALRPDLKWVRVTDDAWPEGKPLLDLAAATV